MPSAHDTLKGRRVRFLVRDIHLPEPMAVLHELHDGEILEGKVVDVSNSGSKASAYVVIEVHGLRQPCILAVDRILRAL